MSASARTIDPDRPYRPSEAAALIPSRRPGRRISVATIHRWINQGWLHAVKIGGGRFIYGVEILRFLQADAGQGDGPVAGAAERPATRNVASRSRVEQQVAVLECKRILGY